MAESEFRVSVIIPVYNAGPYVREAVESALAQPETAEVLLIEDNSPDNSLEVCQHLAAESDRVHLHQHPGGVNRGFPNSLNLGISKSTCDYIAYLDADDYYLPGRFHAAAAVFAEDPEVDGVYDAVDVSIEDNAVLDHWQRPDLGLPTLYSLGEFVAPEDLYYKLITPHVGHLHINGITLHKRIFDKSGYHADLRLHQDTEFFIRIASVGKVVAGSVKEPVANRRIHAQNRISAPRPQQQIFKERMRMARAVYQWSKQNLDREKRDLAADYWVRYGMNIARRENEFARWSDPVKIAFRLMRLPRYAPALLLEHAYYRRLWKQWHMITYPHLRRVWLKLKYEWNRLWK